MRHINYDQEHVDQIAGHFPNVAGTLYTHNISASRYSLANAAAVAGTSTDELQAIMSYRIRHSTAQQPVAEEEAELVA
jgi:hypothetical protein